MSKCYINAKSYNKRALTKKSKRMNKDAMLKLKYQIICSKISIAFCYVLDYHGTQTHLLSRTYTDLKLYFIPLN